MLRDPIALDEAIARAVPLDHAPSAETCKELRRSADIPREVCAAVVGCSLATLKRHESGVPTRLHLDQRYRAFLSVVSAPSTPEASQ